ncbi:MAG: Rid family detoxifying hydrolase [Spirochaetota bacterium]
MIQTVSTDRAPAAIGPYSQATRAGNLLFVSGQLPIDPATGSFVPGGVAEQTAQCLKNLEAILAAAGASLAAVAKTTVYLKHIDEFAAMNEVYAGVFSNNAPARAAFEVGALPKDALVEIEAVAMVDAG